MQERKAAIRKPPKADMETRNAFVDVEKEIAKLWETVNKLKAEEKKEEEEEEVKTAEEDPRGEYTGRAYVDASDFGSGFSPPDHVLTADGAGNTEWAPALGGVVVVGPAGENGRSMSQQLVGVNGSLYVLGALSADTVRCRDLDLIGAAAPGAMALDDLTDVTAPAPGVGEALMWDGAAWVNDTPTASGGVPIGGIIMWSGTIATIPATWALCDGTANAPGPDLRDKFVVGATSDDAGVAKSNILGSLSQSGGATGHSHSGHANLTHAGGAVGDHTGFTHGLSVANHPDLTHAALSHAAQTFTHADHSIASASHTHASQTVSHADISLASFSGSHASQTFSVPSHTHTHAAVAGKASFASGTNRSGMTSIPSESGSAASMTGSVASGTHTHGATTVTQPAHSIASMTGSQASLALAHADHSFPSLSHQEIGTHAATDYGVHSFTAPPAHGTAGTVTHSFTQPSDHSLSAHDTVSMVPSFFALAFIQRMS